MPDLRHKPGSAAVCGGRDVETASGTKPRSRDISQGSGNIPYIFAHTYARAPHTDTCITFICVFWGDPAFDCSVKHTQFLYLVMTLIKSELKSVFMKTPMVPRAFSCGHSQSISKSYSSGACDTSVMLHA